MKIKLLKTVNILSILWLYISTLGKISKTFGNIKCNANSDIVPII